MKTILLATIATLVLAVGSVGQRAEATPLSSSLGVASSVTAPIVRVAVVCGTNGCAPVQVSGPRRHKKLPKAMGR